MFDRRNFLVLALIGGLTACTIAPPLDQSVADELRFQSITVSVSGGQRSLAHIGIQESRFKSDLTGALTRELQRSSRSGTRSVNATFDVTAISFDSMLPGLLRAFPYSHITANVTITDARTGAVILTNRSLSGNDNLGAHNLATSAGATLGLGKSPNRAYHETINGFSADVRRQLLEWDGFMTAVN